MRENVSNLMIDPPVTFCSSLDFGGTFPPLPAPTLTHQFTAAGSDVKLPGKRGALAPEAMWLQGLKARLVGFPEAAELKPRPSKAPRYDGKICHQVLAEQTDVMSLTASYQRAISEIVAAMATQ